VSISLTSEPVKAKLCADQATDPLFFVL